MLIIYSAKRVCAEETILLLTVNDHLLVDYTSDLVSASNSLDLSYAMNIHH
jgi:hypothetical protein